MPRRYTRKAGVNNRGSWAEMDLKEAIDKIQRKEIGINEAAREFGIPSRTLRRRMANKDYRKLTFGRHPVLGFDNEEQLARTLHNIQTHGHNLYRRMVRRIAYLHAEKLGIWHKFNKKKGLAGYDWLTSFLERYPELCLLDGEAHMSTTSNKVIDKLYNDYICDANDFTLSGTSQTQYNKETDNIPPLNNNGMVQKQICIAPLIKKECPTIKKELDEFESVAPTQQMLIVTEANVKLEQEEVKIKKECPTIKKELDEFESVAPTQQMLIVTEANVKLEPEEVEIKVEDSEETMEYILPTSEPDTTITFASEPKDIEMQPVCKEEITFEENPIEVRSYPTDSEVNNAISRINNNAEIADSVEAYITSVVGKEAIKSKRRSFASSDGTTAWPTRFYSSITNIKLKSDQIREADDFDQFAEFIAPRLREMKSAKKQIEIMQNIIALLPR